MQVNIWSDIRCPFCYIGKRKFEAALERFSHKDEVEVIWRSYELDPKLITREDISMYDYFAELKGMTRDHAVQMNDQVSQVAKEIGLDMNMEASVVANSFDGHRLIQLAKAHKIAAEAEEALFHAHFTEGKNIDDQAVLRQIGKAIGLEESAIEELFTSDAYAEEVRQDEQLAESIGVKGVPFFVFNDKYAVSGAQSPDAFLEVLQKSFSEHQS